MAKSLPSTEVDVKPDTELNVEPGTEVGDGLGQECLQAIITKNKKLFTQIVAFLAAMYALMTCMGKGVEYILTDEKISNKVYNMLDAFVNLTIVRLNENNFCPVCP